MENDTGFNDDDGLFGAMDEQAGVDVDAEMGGGAMEGDMEMEDLGNFNPD